MTTELFSSNDVHARVSEICSVCMTIIIRSKFGNDRIKNLAFKSFTPGKYVYAP